MSAAAQLGMPALALTDHNGLYGAVRFYKLAQQAGIKPIIGSELTLEDGSHLTLLAKNREGYRNLCRLITAAHLGNERGKPRLPWKVLSEHCEGLIALSGCRRGLVPSLLASGKEKEAEAAAHRLLDIFGKAHFFLEMQNLLLPEDESGLNRGLAGLAERLGVGLVATNNVHYVRKRDMPLHDIQVCMGELVSVYVPHPRRPRNAENYFKSAGAMRLLFADYPQAVENTLRIAERCSLDLGLGEYHFPAFELPPGETAFSYLYKLCFSGLRKLYRPLTPQATSRLEHELKVILELGFPEYFLCVWDIVRFAKSRGIRCGGRGSAADSLVSYVLGITSVDPIAHNLLFERFLNPERKGMPDIDIDFCSRRRDEVIDYVYQRYGKECVAMVATVNTTQARSAIREVGKALALPPEEVGRIADLFPYASAARIQEAIKELPELREAKIDKEATALLFDLCQGLAAYPRHLGTHLGGLVIGPGPLTDFLPLELAAKGVIISQFDKDDVEDLGVVKMDILGLRTLSAIEDSLSMIEKNHGFRLDIDNLPLDDPATYELLRSTHTVGVFQLESPGMRGLLGRLQPTCFEDVTANISLFRPGPMQADMITPFLTNRHGEQAITYLHPALEHILGESHGVLVYQEQVLRIASALAGFSLGQADSLRRAMTHDRSQEEMDKIGESFIAGAMQRDVSREVAEKVFKQLAAFAAYGFCKAHAAQFGKVAYQTAYLKAHYPAEFLAGILSNQPMGFYPGRVILEEAKRLGIEALPVDVNHSEERFTVEYRQEDGRRVPGIRIGFMQMRDMSQAEIQSILKAREKGPFTSFEDFCARTRISAPVLEHLAEVGAFESLGYSPRELMWVLGPLAEKASGDNGTQALSRRRLLSPDCETEIEARCRMARELPLSPLTLRERAMADYRCLGLSTRCHPLEFRRGKLEELGVIPNAQLEQVKNGSRVRVGGAVICRHRPPTRSGARVIFITLEDETGLADVVIFDRVYQRYGSVIFNHPFLVVEGKLEKTGAKSISILVERVMGL